MIQLSYLDYAAVEGKSWLHRLPARVKMVGVLFVLFGVVAWRSLPGLLVLYLLLVVLFFASRVPRKIFPLTLYPLIFASLFILISRVSAPIHPSGFLESPFRVHWSGAPPGHDSLSLPLQCP